MTKRKFSRKFRMELAKLVLKRFDPAAHACRNPDLAESVQRTWMREPAVAPS